MFEVHETLPLAFFFIGGSYCVTFLITRRYWPLPQPRETQSAKQETTIVISFSQSDFRLQPLLWGHPPSAPSHDTRYAKRTKPTNDQPSRGRLESFVQSLRSLRLPKGREWLIVAILMLACLVLTIEGQRSDESCEDQPSIVQLFRCRMEPILW